MTTTLCVCLAALAQQAIPLRIYAPARSIQDQKIQLQAWGSGTIGETDDFYFEGTTSVRVSARNYFQGGTMLFTDPKDLGAKYEDKTSLLRLTFFLEDAGLVYGVDAQNSRNGKGAPDTVGEGGGATRLGRGRGGAEGKAKAPPFRPKIKNVRLVLTTTDAKRSEIYVPVATSQNEGNGWRSISVPLQAVTGLERTNKLMNEISLSTDTLATLYIGAIEVVSDTTPISAEIKTSRENMALGDEAVFTAAGEAGSTVLSFQWDFDERDGIQVDAEGQVVKRKFRKPGVYNVTLTISDKYGLKKPMRKTVLVTVNP